MSKRIEIPMALETSGIAKGAKDAEKALSSLEDAAADTGKGGAKDLDRLEDELKDVAKASDRAGDAGDDAGDKMRRGFGRAEDGVKDFKGEANQTAKETAASFDGSAESIGDMFQELAANAFGGFGPAGAAAGLAAAAGLGLLFSEWQKNADNMEERTSRMYDAMMDANVAYVNEAVIQNGILQASEEDKDEARRVAALAGVEEEIGRRAIAGDTIAQNEIILGLTERLGRARADELAAASSGQQDVAKGFAQEQRSIEATISQVSGLSGAFGKAAQDAAVTQSAVKNIGLDAEEAERKARGIAQGLGTIPKDVSVRMVVDDSAIRNYRPQPIKIPATLETRGREWN